MVNTRNEMDGEKLSQMTSVTNAGWTSISNIYDDNGDGTIGRLQTIDTTTDGAGLRTELAA